MSRRWSNGPFNQTARLIFGLTREWDTLELRAESYCLVLPGKWLSQMDSASSSHNPGGVPDGYVAVALSIENSPSPIRLCVLVRRDADPINGRLVVLREAMDARVLLGCVCDAGERVQRWIEIWVQHVELLRDAPQAVRDALTAPALEARWSAHAKALRQIDPAAFIETGWESGHPPAMAIDPAAMRCVAMPAAEDARLIPLNPGGGLMLIKSFSPVRLEPFFDFLSGGAWEGMFGGKSALIAGEVDRALRQYSTRAADEGWLFLGVHGKWGRLLEAFHLKLRLLADAVDAVRALAQQIQQPMLNLSSESFQVQLGSFGAALPFLWTARASLVSSGDAMVLPVEQSEMRYFLRTGAAGTSIYQPAAAGAPVAGVCAVRIRQLIDQSDGAVIEGTFTTQERLAVSINDLLQLQLGIGESPRIFHAHIETRTALAGGEWRFRTIPQPLPAAMVEQLKAAAGVQRSNCWFAVIPLLSTPVDLYSLAVICTRALLCNKQTTLAIALDELLSLAREMGAAGAEKAAASAGKPAASELPGRIRTVFGRDPRWILSLGPHRLLDEEVDPADAFDLVPAELWWDTLAALVRAFPAVSADSTCADFGDAPLGAIHRVFDRLADDLASLLLRTRSLIVIDWRSNREIHAVIRGHLGTSPGAKSSPVPGAAPVPGAGPASAPRPPNRTVADATSRNSKIASVT